MRAAGAAPSMGRMSTIDNKAIADRAPSRSWPTALREDFDERRPPRVPQPRGQGRAAGGARPRPRGLLRDRAVAARGVRRPALGDPRRGRSRATSSSCTARCPAATCGAVRRVRRAGAASTRSSRPRASRFAATQTHWIRVADGKVDRALGQPRRPGHRQAARLGAAPAAVPGAFGARAPPGAPHRARSGGSPMMLVSIEPRRRKLTAALRRTDAAIRAITSGEPAPVQPACSTRAPTCRCWRPGGPISAARRRCGRRSRGWRAGSGQAAD